MTVMALALAYAREDECDYLEGRTVYDDSGEVLGWLGQVMDESGHPCEYRGMGDTGYTSCWSSSEISRLRGEVASLRGDNECLRELVMSMYELMRSGSRTTYEWAYVEDRMNELGIEAE